MEHDPETLDPIARQYLNGFFAGLASGKQLPFAGHLPDGRIAADPASGATNGTVEPAEETFFGIPLSELSREERWKHEQNPLDAWESIVKCAQTEAPPEGGDVYRFKFHGLFYVAPAQDSFMLRVRVPGNVMTSAQLTGLAEIAEEWGGGYGDVTTRGNIQLRELAPKHVVRVLMKLHDLGLVSRGSGADNVRNITATPTSGFDPLELCDVRPYARALQFYLLNHRDLYGIPRKFNVAFDSGGSVSVVADTNDLAFVACRVGAGRSIPEGIYFRVLLAGITGHGDFARDAGIAVTPEESVAVAAAMLRVFNEHGDRTNRKKARLKYLIERWGIPRFLEETQGKLAFPLRRVPEPECEPRAPVVRHGHLGVRRQRQEGLNYIGVTIPAGRLRAPQMKRLAAIAQCYGSGRLCPTVWQNVMIPDVPDAGLDAATAALLEGGFRYEASAIAGGIVACTGNSGCKFSATETKGHALALGAHLESRLKLDQPLNIHLTGCPHSCAQHYVGDIGLLGVKVTVDGRSVEAYNVLVGGGTDDRQALARELITGVPFTELPEVLERLLKGYVEARNAGESFPAFCARHGADALRALVA